jgi:hypothetical protein
MYNIIGKEIRVCVFYKEFIIDDKLIATHTKYESLKVKEVIDFSSDYKEYWSHYKLLMSDNSIINYFSPEGLILKS